MGATVPAVAIAGRAAQHRMVQSRNFDGPGRIAQHFQQDRNPYQIDAPRCVEFDDPAKDVAFDVDIGAPRIVRATVRRDIADRALVEVLALDPSDRPAHIPTDRQATDRTRRRARPRRDLRRPRSHSRRGMSADGRQDHRNHSRSVERQYPLGTRRYRAAKPSDFLEWSAKRRVDAHAHGRQRELALEVMLNNLRREFCNPPPKPSKVRHLSALGQPSITIVPVGSKVPAAGITIHALVRHVVNAAYAMPAARQSKERSRINLRQRRPAYDQEVSSPRRSSRPAGRAPEKSVFGGSPGGYAFQKNLSVWIWPSGARQRMTRSSFIASTIGGGPAK